MSALTATTGFINFGWRLARREWMILSVPMLTYALLVAVFASIYNATPLEELPEAIRVNAQAMIWYLALTEMITFAGGYVFPEVRIDILDSQFAASLPRPLSYFRTKLWSWAGQTAGRVLVFFVFGLGLATLFSGAFLPSPIMLLLMLLSVYIGAMLYGIVYFSLALLEVWGPYARPAMWISQKFCFLLGGLLLPITIYPDWLEKLAWLTPYPALLHISGRLAFDLSADQIIHGLLLQVFWLVVTILIGFGMQTLAIRKILKRGH